MMAKDKNIFKFLARNHMNLKDYDIKIANTFHLKQYLLQFYLMTFIIMSFYIFKYQMYRRLT